MFSWQPTKLSTELLQLLGSLMVVKSTWNSYAECTWSRQRKRETERERQVG